MSISIYSGVKKLSIELFFVQWSTFDELNKLQSLEELHFRHIPKLGEAVFVRGIVIAKIARLTQYNRTKVSRGCMCVEGRGGYGGSGVCVCMCVCVRMCLKGTLCMRVVGCGA